MSNLIYVEGYSEENLVLKLFQSIGRSCSTESTTIFSTEEIDYLKNCRGDSGIIPALTNDSFKLKQAPQKKLILIRDIDSTVCYSTYKQDIREYLVSEGVVNPFFIINSRPEIEFHYLENIELLKRVMVAYINQRKSLSINNFTELNSANQLDPNNYHTIQKVLTANGAGFSKKDFSERFFATLFSQGHAISIATRLQSNL